MMDPKILRQTLGAEVVGYANQVVVRAIGVVVVVTTVVVIVVVIVVIVVVVVASLLHVDGLIRQILVVLIRAE